MRTEIAAQMEIITLITDSLKEHVKHHNSCPPSLKQSYVVVSVRIVIGYCIHNEILMSYCVHTIGY